MTSDLRRNDVRYKRTDIQTLMCDEGVGGCGATFESTVTIDTLSGVAGVTCPHCGKTQEPWRVD